MLGYLKIMYMPRSLQPGRPRPHKQEIVSDLPARRTLPLSGFCLPGPFPRPKPFQFLSDPLLLSPPAAIPVDFCHWGRNHTSQNWWMIHLPEELIMSPDPAPSDPLPNPCLVPSHSTETLSQLQKTSSKHAWPHKPKLVNDLLACKILPLPWILSLVLLMQASTIWTHLFPDTGEIRDTRNTLNTEI